MFAQRRVPSFREVECGNCHHHRKEVRWRIRKKNCDSVSKAAAVGRPRSQSLGQCHLQRCRRRPSGRTWCHTRPSSCFERQWSRSLRIPAPSNRRRRSRGNNLVWYKTAGTVLSKMLASPISCKVTIAQKTMGSANSVIGIPPSVIDLHQTIHPEWSLPSLAG